MASLVRVYASGLDSKGASLFWAQPATETLVRSLREAGQLDPVLVRLEGERYRLLSGYQRVEWLSRENRGILARCLSAPACPVQDGLLYLHANTHRNLDEVMRVRALRYFQPRLGPEELARRVAPLLGLAPQSGAWRRHLDWLTLPVAWDDLLQVGNVPLTVGQQLTGLEPEELEALYPYFATWKWSQGRAGQWLTLLHEAALRQGWSLGQTLECALAPDVLASHLAPQDALHRLTAQAMVLRYPNLDRLERRFASLVREVFGPASPWKITHGPGFESDTVELRLRAGNSAQFRNAARVLSRAAGAANLDGLFELTLENGQVSEA